MQTFNHVLNPRSSSATLSMAGPPLAADPTLDDHTIAQQLLNNTRSHGRNVSIASISMQSSLQGYDGSTARVATADPAVAEHEPGRPRRRFHTSNTWTSSSGDVMSEGVEMDDRSMFVDEYNRLAKKHCVRTITLDDDDNRNDGASNGSGRSGGWFSRRILRKTSSSHSIRIKPERELKHRRSISDSLRLKSRKDGLKDKDLQELVRICGSCLLYLPSEYASGSLAVPTCFRATAQYLVQHAPTARGVFRIPGNHKVVSQLYNHYCTLDADGAQIAGTVRCPALPEHIHCDVHDVASSFKWMLSGLPGGILGSLALFDALISIQTQLQAYPEITRTKQSKFKARLIALAIATLKSQYRRDLICAVFGLLSMIGRTAENTKREDERGRPLPTADLMGYAPLSVVFGPCLVGKLLDNYTMRLVNPHGGLILLPISPPKSKRDKHKKAKTSEDGSHFNTFVDKMKIANMITEMLITNWRDVVRHMRNLGESKMLSSSRSLNIMGPVVPTLRPSASESFALRKPPDWDERNPAVGRGERSISPTPTRSNAMKGKFVRNNVESTHQQDDGLKVRKQRSRPNRMSIQLSGQRSTGFLESTTEDSPSKDDTERQTGAVILGSQNPALPKKNKSEDKDVLHPQNLSKDNGYSKTPGDVTGLDYQELQDEIQKYSSKHRTMVGAPSIRISRATDIPEGVVSGHVRRIAASEPGINPDLRIPSRRRVSKSLHVVSKGKKSGFATNAGAKDPLSEVSKEEDLASLAMLAQALASEHSGTEIAFKISNNDLQSAIATNSLARTPSISNKRPMPNSFTPRDIKVVEPLSDVVPAGGKTREWSSNTNVSLNLIKNTGLPINNTTITYPPVNTPLARPVTRNSPVKILGTPTGSVRALAARFNGADLTETGTSRSSISPSKASISNFQPWTELRKDSLVAPYTVNPPSPTRSFKSIKSTRSEKTPQATFKNTQEHVLGQPIQKGDEAPPRCSARESIQSTGSLQATNDGHTSSSFVHANRGNDTQPLKLPQHMDSPAIKSNTPMTHSLTNISEPKMVTSLDGPSPVSSIDHSASSQLLQARENLPASMKAVETVATDNAVCVPARANTRLGSPVPSLVSPHVHFDASKSWEIPQADEDKDSLVEKCFGTRTISSTPPVRTNSTLHTQIRTLQMQLSAKSEEICQLKQRLDVRSNLDIGTMSDQIRDLKKELQMWKTRAENAEKQVDLLTRMHSKVSSEQNTNSIPAKMRSEQVSALVATFNENRPTMSGGTRRTAHGMDGTASSQVWDPEGTTDTVVRELRHTISGNEYSLWVERIGMALDLVEPHELE